MKRYGQETKVSVCGRDYVCVCVCVYVCACACVWGREVYIHVTTDTCKKKYVSLFVYLIFNNYSLNAKWILFNIVVYLVVRLGDYSIIFPEPEANNCFSMTTQVIIWKKEVNEMF